MGPRGPCAPCGPSGPGGTDYTRIFIIIVTIVTFIIAMPLIVTPVLVLAIICVVIVGASHKRIFSAHRSISFVNIGETPLQHMLIFDESILIRLEGIVNRLFQAYKIWGAVVKEKPRWESQIKAVGWQPLFSLLRDGNLKQHMKNRYLCFKMLQLFIRILDYPVAKWKRVWYNIEYSSFSICEV